LTTRKGNKGMKRKAQRKDLAVRMVLDCIGSTMALLGLAGIAGASEGEGNFLIALTVFGIGMLEVLWSYQR
jgi:hypothetical protein